MSAIHLPFSPPATRCSPSLPCSAAQWISSSASWKCCGAVSPLKLAGKNWKNKSAVFKVRSNLETAGAKVGQVTEVTQDTFWPIVNAAGDKTVVLDMYTQWCGPCKIIAPKYKELSEKYLDVVFLRLDCNQENKALAKELGIRVVPTFKILKDSKIVKVVTGAKFDDLVFAIDTVRST